MLISQRAIVRVWLVVCSRARAFELIAVKYGDVRVFYQTFRPHCRWLDQLLHYTLLEIVHETSTRIQSQSRTRVPEPKIH